MKKLLFLCICLLGTAFAFAANGNASTACQVSILEGGAYIRPNNGYWLVDKQTPKEWYTCQIGQNRYRFSDLSKEPRGFQQATTAHVLRLTNAAGMKISVAKVKNSSTYFISVGNTTFAYNANDHMVGTCNYEVLAQVSKLKLLTNGDKKEGFLLGLAPDDSSVLVIY